MGVADYARHLLNLRRRRYDAFPGVELGEPTWDILLDLFVQEAHGRRVSISSVSVGSALPPTTALRHLARLVEQGHLIREDDAADRRRAYVTLSPETKATLTRQLEMAMREVGI